MERNDDNIGNLGGSSNAGQGGLGGSTGGYGNSGDLTGASGYGSTTGGSTGSDAGFGSTGAGSSGLSGSGLSGSGASGSTGAAEGVGDRARELAGGARERLADGASTLRERASGAKNSLADMLEAGANRLNNQGGSTQLSGSSTGALASDGGNRLAAVAGGLQGSADWLREADIDGMRQGVENQVRTNPGRTLLIAAGLGYLLGKAFRR